MEINEKHEEMMKELLNVKVLPDVVVKYYKRIKKLADRKDVLITDQVLLMVCSIAETLPEAEGSPEKPSESTPVVLSEEEEKGEKPVEIETGVPCKVFFDGKAYDATYLDKQDDVEPGESLVRLRGETIAITVPDNNVKLKEG